MAIWAVCLYDEVGGNSFIEFVNCETKEQAEVEAINLNEPLNTTFQISATATVPDFFLTS